MDEQPDIDVSLNLQQPNVGAISKLITVDEIQAKPVQFVNESSHG